jgi:YegS/Rv2252/BmrU family lipid kinase
MPELVESACDLERVGIIFNPASGTEDLETRRAKLEELAHEAGLRCALVETDIDRGAAPLAKEAVADGMQRVIVSGGDGSVSEAADALTGTDTALAVLPGGTGNLLAINLGLPLDAKEAMELALHGEARPMDVGRANGQVFLIMAGIGADARMIRDADRELKNRLGPLAYFVAACRNLGRPRLGYTITIDGNRFRRYAHTVMVANLGRVTGGVELVPGTSPESGTLEVAILRARTLWDLGKVAAGAIMGRIRSDNLLEIQHGRNVIIQTRRPQPVQIDGNEAGSTNRLEIHVEPGALKLVRPPAAELEPATAVPQQVSEAVTRSWAPVLAVGVLAGLAYAIRRWRSARNS